MLGHVYVQPVDRQPGISYYHGYAQVLRAPSMDMSIAGLYTGWQTSERAQWVIGAEVTVPGRAPGHHLTVIEYETLLRSKVSALNVFKELGLRQLGNTHTHTYFEVRDSYNVNEVFSAACRRIQQHPWARLPWMRVDLYERGMPTHRIFDINTDL